MAFNNVNLENRKRSIIHNFSQFTLLELVAYESVVGDARALNYILRKITRILSGLFESILVLSLDYPTKKQTLKPNKHHI